MEAVRARGLVRRFEQRAAIEDVDLSVSAGEVRGLLGPNGAGKTTLLRMLFGLVRPDAGSIELLGRPLDALAPGALGGVAGFVEEPAFYPFLSGRSNLALLSRLDLGEHTSNRIDEVLGRVGLKDRARDRVGDYSTGMRQRLGIAAALLRRPRLLLLDEPTSALDPVGASAVALLVRELAEEGVAVILSSHQIGELERVCRSYTILNQGHVVWEGTSEQADAQAPASAYSLATADDQEAIRIAQAVPGVRAQRSPAGDLVVLADAGGMDRFVLALGDARLVIRRLELRVSPLESLFFARTGER